MYALWRSPELLPPLVVHAPVSEFVLRGADVMLPGVVFSSAEEVAGLRKGELRAVFARGNPGAIAVGEMLVDAEDIARTGKKGRALKLWHVMGDELWKLGPKTVPNDGFIGDRVLSINAQTGEALDDSDQEEAETEVNVADISLEDEEKAAPEPEATEDQPLNEEDEAISKEQMDAWYVDSLLQALRSSKVKEKELPMLASTFHANVLLPSRRANVSLNLKQSSFKKLSAFLRQMEQRGLVAVVEKDGVQSIAGISRRHPCVTIVFVLGSAHLYSHRLCVVPMHLVTFLRTKCTSLRSKSSWRKRPLQTLRLVYRPSCLVSSPQRLKSASVYRPRSRHCWQMCQAWMSLPKSTGLRSKFETPWPRT